MCADMMGGNGTTKRVRQSKCLEQNDGGHNPPLGQSQKMINAMDPIIDTEFSRELAEIFTSQKA